MEVLLKRSIDNLGRLGDVVTVRKGYGRNYLLPLGFAVPVTKANLQQIEKERALAMSESTMSGTTRGPNRRPDRGGAPVLRDAMHSRAPVLHGLRGT